MKKIVFAAFMFCVFCGCRLSENRTIEKQMQADFKGFRAVSWIEYNKYCGDSKKPGIVSADFNGDGIKDFAILIKKETGLEVEKIYVAYFGNGKGLNKPVVLEKLNTKKFQNEVQFIALLKPGNYKIIEGNVRNRVPVEIPYYGIRGGTCESASWIWYWNSKKAKFMKVWTSD